MSTWLLILLFFIIVFFLTMALLPYVSLMKLSKLEDLDNLVIILKEIKVILEKRNKHDGIH